MYLARCNTINSIVLQFKFFEVDQMNTCALFHPNDYKIIMAVRNFILLPTILTNPFHRVYFEGYVCRRLTKFKYGRVYCHQVSIDAIINYFLSNREALFNAMIMASPISHLHRYKAAIAPVNF